MSSKSSSPVRNNFNAQQRRQAITEGRQGRQRREGREDPDSHKIFLTNLNGDMSETQVQAEVKKLFEKYGEVTKLSLKKHKNGYYYFGFLQYPKGFQAYEAVKALDQYSLFGKNMKVRQDRQSQGCFYCKRMGHFARQCPQNRGRRRSYSNQRRSRDRHDRRREDRYDRIDRRQHRDYRQRDRYQRGDRYENDRDHDRERDRHRHQKRRHRQRSYSDSRSSSQSSYRRQDRKDKKKQQRRRRSRS